MIAIPVEEVSLSAALNDDRVHLSHNDAEVSLNASPLDEPLERSMCNNDESLGGSVHDFEDGSLPLSSENRPGVEHDLPFPVPFPVPFETIQDVHASRAVARVQIGRTPVSMLVRVCRLACIVTVESLIAAIARARI